MNIIYTDNFTLERKFKLKQNLFIYITIISIYYIYEIWFFSYMILPSQTINNSDANVLW